MLPIFYEGKQNRAGMKRGGVIELSACRVNRASSLVVFCVNQTFFICQKFSVDRRNAASGCLNHAKPNNVDEWPDLSRVQKSKRNQSRYKAHLLARYSQSLEMSKDHSNFRCSFLSSSTKEETAL